MVLTNNAFSLPFMDKTRFCKIAAALLLAAGSLHAEKWLQFPGPTHQGLSVEKGLPLT